MYRSTVAAALLLISLSVGTAQADEFTCGSLENGVGPFDYNDPAIHVPNGENPMGQLKRVENVHFHAGMQYLNIRNYSPERIRSEFAYTLRAFPNHRLALNAFSRLEQFYSKQLPGAGKALTADCFFDRAIRFRPEDKGVRFVHAMHLHRQGKLKDALTEYELAEKLGEESANFHYNYGLLLADMKKWDQARTQAEIAYSRGIPLPGLADKLQRNGHPVRAKPGNTETEASGSTEQKE
ncbi:hypothetical protein [Zoogloea sp.]|uniref:hypothetical protein n=1 Tax=Zoogloea sp. TaxID=49181 RepID=UPI002606E85E|nr:hypothetical protein [Zoogloea sp.]MDD3352555.1 hypothetical protein [Zoogloea sp.]